MGFTIYDLSLVLTILGFTIYNLSLGFTILGFTIYKFIISQWDWAASQHVYCQYAGYEAYAESYVYLIERVPTQYDAACTYAACDEKCEAQPPHGVKRIVERQDNERAIYCANGCCVGTDVIHLVDYHTSYLHKERHVYHTDNEGGHVVFCHHIEAIHIAGDGNYIGYGAQLAARILMVAPRHKAPIERDEIGGQSDGKHIHKGQNNDLIVDAEHSQRRKADENQDAEQREVVGREEYAEYFRCEYDVLIFHCSESGL